MGDLVHSTSSMPSSPESISSSREYQVFLFGDLTVSFEKDLRLLLHVKDNPTLRSFFEQASFAFREACARLPSHQQAWFPQFTTIIDLLSKLRDREGAPALSFALLCLCEIGQFIRYISHSPILSTLVMELTTISQPFRTRIETLPKCF